MNNKAFKILKDSIFSMKKGEKFYVNTIDMTVSQIDTIRFYIKKGIIIPDEVETKIIYKDVAKVMSGETILPQNYYYKGESKEWMR